MVEKPAPGDLALVVDFVNTHHIHPGGSGEPHSIDAFSDPAGVPTWLKEHGLIAKTAKPVAAEVDETIAVREALRALLRANNGLELDARAFAVLNRASGAAHFAIGFGEDADVTIEPLAKGVRGALGHLLSIVADSMADGKWARFKVCLADDCGEAFFDEARNHSRKWCDMAECGNREKARAYRRRHGSSTPS